MSGAQLDVYADGLMSAALILSCLFFFALFVHNMWQMLRLMKADLGARYNKQRRAMRKRWMRLRAKIANACDCCRQR